MLNKISFNLTKTGIGFLVCFNCIHSLTQNSQAATLSRFSGTIENLSIPPITTLDFIDYDFLSQLIGSQQRTTNLNDSVEPQTIVEAISNPENISLDSIISSLSEISFDTERGDRIIEEVPILPQVAASDIYKDIYDFGTAAAEELRDPLSVGALPTLEAPAAPPAPRGGVRTTTTGVVGTPSPNRQQPALPRFGGPVAIIGGPAQNFVTPLRQVVLPSTDRVQAGNWGDDQVDVFFASLPQQEVVDIDTFMRTVYRTGVSDMIKQIDATLDLTVDAEFNSMPAEVFPQNAMPSGEFNRSL